MIPDFYPGVKSARDRGSDIRPTEVGGCRAFGWASAARTSPIPLLRGVSLPVDAWRAGVGSNIP